MKGDFINTVTLAFILLLKALENHWKKQMSYPVPAETKTDALERHDL